MKRRAFDELNRRHRVEAACYFHQRSLKEAAGLPPQFGLCAALVELWVAGDDPFRAYNMRDLVMRQARHAYLLPRPLERDLETLHGAPLVESRTCAAPPFDSCDAPGLRLLLLRYDGRGHRMAFLVEPGGVLRFFDPNAGEAIFAAASDFVPWFADFWQVGGYARRSPAVTLYRFTPRAAAETVTRGS
jgi:hypothetical protein